MSARNLEEKVRALLALIKTHRTTGDGDLDAAVAAVEYALVYARPTAAGK
jgi:hypothetical protein